MRETIYALPPRAKNDFCCPHVVFEQPGQRRPICIDVGGAPALFSFKCCATISASARMNTGESFSDSARCTSIPSCVYVYVVARTMVPSAKPPLRNET
jgi:hypothetical protein